MTKIVWDEVGSRRFESGLDKGVLYLEPTSENPNGSAVPWNGLTSVVEKFNKSTTPVFYDGVKIGNDQTLGYYTGTLSAVTYPEEFEVLEGSSEIRPGMMMSDQPLGTFALCYRTAVGDDNYGAFKHYRLHIIYNLTAIPSDKTFGTIGDDPNLVPFSWDLSAVPEEIPGFRPTAQMTLNSKDFDPWLLEEIEGFFYGTESEDAILMPMPVLADYITNWFRIQIIDNGDGTWTATFKRDELMRWEESDIFEILSARVEWISDDEYIIHDLFDISELKTLEIIDHGNGLWTAKGDLNIKVADDGTFVLNEANLPFESEDMFRITNTEPKEEPTWVQ